MISCAKNTTSNDTQTSTTSSTTTTSSASGSVTGVPGSTSPTEVTTGDSAPTTATSVASTGEGCMFLNCDDMNDWNECDIWTQDCPEGQKCVPYAYSGGNAWDALKCVDVTGMAKPGEECTIEGALTGIDSCIEGAMCWNVMEDMGTCIGLCSGSPEAPVCDPPGVCYFSRVFQVCFPTCDPLLQDCPDAGSACYHNGGDNFECAPDDSGAEGQANDPCDFLNRCDPGLMCADPASAGVGCVEGSPGCCTPFCPFPDGACPNPDQQCVQYFDPIMLPENDPQLGIGVCGVPA